MKKIIFLPVFILSLTLSCAPQTGPDDNSPQPYAGSWARYTTEYASPDTASGTVISIHEDQIYVAFQDGSQANSLSVRRFDGTNWISFGQAVSSNVAGSINLEFSSSNTAYLSYRDGFSPGPAMVQKQGGMFWSYFGTNNQSPGGAQYISLTLLSNIHPVQAYCDLSANFKMSVKVYHPDSDTWSYLGGQGFTTAAVGFNDIAVLNGSPYVAYESYTNSSHSTSVRHWNGVSWDFVGTYLINSGVSRYINLDFYNGQPVVAQVEDSTNIRVYTWSGSAWNQLGQDLVFSGSVDYLDLLVLSQPLLIFSDPDYANAASVYRWDSTQWVPLGTRGFTSVPVSYCSLDADSQGTIYAAFVLSNRAAVWVWE